MITAKVNIAGALAAIDKAAEGARKAAVVSVAEWLQHVITKSFEAQASPEGVPWKPLSEPYATLKATGGGEGGRKVGVLGLTAFKRILESSGELFRDATWPPTIVGNTITAGSVLPYAGAHQFGANISIPEFGPRNAAVLRFYSSDLRAIFAKRVRAHTVTIPARPYLPSPEFAEQEGAKVAEEAIQDAIDQAGAGPAVK